MFLDLFFFLVKWWFYKKKNNQTNKQESPDTTKSGLLVTLSVKHNLHVLLLRYCDGTCYFYLEPVIPTYLTRCFYFSWNCLSNLKILWENSGMFHPIKISLKARCREKSLRDINAGDFFSHKKVGSDTKTCLFFCFISMTNQVIRASFRQKNYGISNI